MQLQLRQLTQFNTSNQSGYELECKDSSSEITLDFRGSSSGLKAEDVQGVTEYPILKSSNFSSNRF